MVQEVLRRLAKMYPDAQCELIYRNPFELLIATILSAQSTDRQVNKITPGLFAKYPTPHDFIPLTEEELANEIKGLGLYRNKSRSILKTCFLLVSKHKGRVPNQRKELEELPGVGRKTANVVLSNAFHIPALAVDTHVHRVANRIGLTQSKRPIDTEMQLLDQIPKEEWTDTHHRLIWHGRRICIARKPKCSKCDLFNLCEYALQHEKH